MPATLTSSSHPIVALPLNESRKLLGLVADKFSYPFVAPIIVDVPREIKFMGDIKYCTVAFYRQVKPLTFLNKFLFWHMLTKIRHQKSISAFKSPVAYSMETVSVLAKLNTA